MINRQRIAALLDEKQKNAQAPALNNPLARPANTLQANPMAIPSPAMGGTMPMAPAAPGMPTPGFKAPRFGNLASKLRIK